MSFSVAAVLLLGVWRHRVAGVGLTPAVVVTAVWAALLAWHESGRHLSHYQVLLAELGQDSAWLMTIGFIFQGATGRYRKFLRFGGILAACVLLLVATLLAGMPDVVGVRLENSGLMSYGGILLAFIGLVGLEQIFRNARPGQRPSLKYLCYGIALLFGYDLVMNVAATLRLDVADVFWSARGYVDAMAVPLLIVAVRRGSAWQRGLFASRQVVFYSAVLVAAAAYLAVVAVLGLYIRVSNDQWGRVAQLVFLSAAALLFLMMLFSDVLRGKLAVFVNKHFFETKYDYRNEWLRLIDTLTSTDDPLPLQKKCIKSLAQVVGAESGVLWLRNADTGGFECSVGWNVAPSERSVAAEAEFVRFLEDRAWVVDLEAVGSDGARLVPADAAAVGDRGLLVPLVNESDLLGFVVLPKRANSESLDFEDFDLLKTAGRQIASYLLQETLTARMFEVRQFEAFNRLTAYLMHDLNNLVAQQSLVVENAARFKNNPEFIDDAIETVRSGVVRMRKVLELLKQRDHNESKVAVDLQSLVREAVDECGDRRPAPALAGTVPAAAVLADPSRLRMAIYHAIRNAQDATPEHGTVTVSVDGAEGRWVVEIADTGEGMDAAFIRERLFRPFDTTKGMRGMGIGAYQVREYVRGIGGRVRVDSVPGEGTRFRVYLPAHALAPAREARAGQP